MNTTSFLPYLLLPLLVACGSSSDDTGAIASASSASSTSAGGMGQGGMGQGGMGQGGAAAGGGGSAAKSAVDEVSQLLIGRFDSSNQSQQKPSYFSVNLVACTAPAPELGAKVLYIEQAISSNLSAPYRQRLYVITPGDDAANQARSTVYSLNTPSAFVGYCSRRNKETISANQASERSGCHVNLTRSGDGFVGGTEGKDCSSTMNGASYATSEVTLDPERIESWDRGFNASDAQVWGATAGAYIFDRKTPFGQEP